MSNTRGEMIESMRRFPGELSAAVSGLDDADLHTPYMDGEWTVAQNVHHLADSHLHAFIRVKSALVEDRPTFALYDQDVWATTKDVLAVPIQASMMMLSGLHERWCALWDSLDDDHWNRVAVHPTAGDRTIESFLELYSGHGPRHVDQIRQTLAAKP